MRAKIPAYLTVILRHKHPMAKAVSCWFDSATEAKIQGLWQEISARGFDSTMSEGPYRPHVTLGVCGELNVSKFSDELRKLAKSIDEVPFDLSSVGIFPNDPPVVFLSLTQTNKLRDIHSKIHSLMADHGSAPVPYYLPESWVPHCTLAPWVDRAKVADLVEYLVDLRLPISGRISRIGIIDTPAEIMVSEITLEVL